MEEEGDHTHTKASSTQKGRTKRSRGALYKIAIGEKGKMLLSVAAAIHALFVWVGERERERQAANGH